MLRSDRSLQKNVKDFEFLKKYKPEILKILEEEKQKRMIEARQRLYNSRLEFSYYFGDWYRAIGVFFENGDTPDWGNIGHPFKNAILNEVFCDYGYANPGRITNYLEKFFSIDLNTTEEEFLEKFPDLEVEIKEYNDLQGMGKYISRVIFPNYQTFEKYLLKAGKPLIEAKERTEKLKKELQEKARKTGKPQLFLEYHDFCNDRDLECSIDIIRVYIDAEGKEIEERIHTY